MFKSFTKELLPMKRVFHKSKSFKEAEEWDVLQHARLTPEQRLKAAAELKRRVFGDDVPKIRKVQVQK
jgi:hypothetical protein